MGSQELDPASQSLTSYRLGDITVDPARRAVYRGDKTLQLGKLTYELLLLLVEAAPRVVSQDEVAERLWHARPVTQDTVRQRVKLLRKALADDAEDPRYVSVVRGQGYRLIPSVRFVSTESPPPIWIRQKLLLAGLTVVVFATLSFVYWGAPDGRTPANMTNASIDAGPNKKSIAVLPFESLMPDVENDFIVDGIHNDLLTQLAKVKSLKVISRTSVLGYQGKTKNVRLIGDELNVATVLEGSVQRSGDMVRINVQLIDAENDEHLWAERYDRELTVQNLFAIQSEIATSIATALQAIISPEELARINELPTENTRAYNHYLVANKHLRGTNNQKVFLDAAKALQHAVDEDPGFALAWALLSRAHSAVYYFVDRTEARREMARHAIDRAFALNAELPEAHYAMGYFQYHCLADTDAALREWDLAAQNMSGDARIYEARTYVFRRIGDFEQAIANQSRAIELDPRNIEHLFVQWHNFASLRDYAQAKIFSDRIVETVPDRSMGYILNGYIALWRDGDANSVKTVLNNAPIEIGSQRLGWVATLYERDYDEVLKFLDSWKIDVDDKQNYYTPLSSYYGLTYDLSGIPDVSAQHFQKALTTIETELENKPDDPRLLIALGSVLGRMGHRDAAVTSIRQAIELAPTSKNATRGPALLMSAVLAFLAAGDHNAALDELNNYLAAPAVWSIEGLLPDPRLDSVRENPRFNALVQKYSR